jgi:hypothetical protein
METAGCGGNGAAEISHVEPALIREYKHPSLQIAPRTFSRLLSLHHPCYNTHLMVAKTQSESPPATNPWPDASSHLFVQVSHKPSRGMWKGNKKNHPTPTEGSLLPPPSHRSSVQSHPEDRTQHEALATNMTISPPSMRQWLPERCPRLYIG